MNKNTFKEQIFIPLAKECVDNILFYMDDNGEYIATGIIQTIDYISNELPNIHLPNAKYITFSLLRTHLVKTDEFLYSVRIFDEKFMVNKELGADCFYDAFWLTERFKKFSNSIESHVNKSMIKHSPVYINELMAKIVNDFNICFVRTAKNILDEYNNASLQGFTVLAGDYIFSPRCLKIAKYEKIKEFNSVIV